MRNGRIFINVLQECVDAFNSNRFPEIKSTWEYIVSEENQKLMNSIIEKFKEELKFKNVQAYEIEETIEEFFSQSYGLDDPV